MSLQFQIVGVRQACQLSFPSKLRSGGVGMSGSSPRTTPSSAAGCKLNFRSWPQSIPVVRFQQTAAGLRAPFWRHCLSPLHPKEISLVFPPLSFSLVYGNVGHVSSDKPLSCQYSFFLLCGTAYSTLAWL